MLRVLCTLCMPRSPWSACIWDRACSRPAPCCTSSPNAVHAAHAKRAEHAVRAVHAAQPAERLHLELDTRIGAWAVLNVSGDVRAWSLDELVAGGPGVSATQWGCAPIKHRLW